MRIFILLWVLSFSVMLSAQTPKQLYISNDDHTDYLWAGNESQYKEAFIKMLDYYIEQSDKTAALPSPYQSRFNCDGSYWLWQYEKYKSQADFLKLISKIKSGHISFPYNTLVSTYGANNVEGTLRGMYYAGYLERKYQLDLDQAIAMEDQTLPLGLSSLWAGSGAKYSWKGVCACASKMTDLQKRNDEVYWYRGLDSSAILMKWYSLAPGGNKQFGGYSEARDPALAVDQLTSLCQSPRYPYHIAGAFGYGWDDLHTTTDIFTTTAQQKTNADREVIVSNQSDFFKAFEKTYGTSIPSQTLSYGNEWDVYSASMAELTSKVKRSVEKIRSAEAMASVVTSKDQNFGRNLDDMRRGAWVALGQYYEHNWNADGPVTRADRAVWQRKIEKEISTYVDSLYTLSKEKLGGLIKNNGHNTRFYVFNSLSWKRTDVCDFPYAGSAKVRVIDTSTNEAVPSQYIISNGKKYIRILATDIPSVGYKVYEIRQGKSQFSPTRAAPANNILENTFYKLTLTNQGVITSLIDKGNGNRECVSNVNGKFMNDLGSGLNNTGTLVVTQSGPVSIEITCTGKTPLAHISRITLFKEIRRIDIHNQITQNFSDVNSWAFSYNLQEADVWHEEVGAIIHAKPTTEGGHYATMNARFDWLTVNHFVDINRGNYGITLSNADCAFMKLGNSFLTNLDTKTSQLSILAGGQVDGDALGIPRQGGDSIFTQRFAIGTHLDFDAAAAMRFSLEHQNPLVSGLVTGTTEIFPQKVYSFLTINDPQILLWSLKPAEDGPDKGLIARVWNFAQRDSDLKISFDGEVNSAHRTTHVETDIEEAQVVNGDVLGSIGHHQLSTFRILLKQE